MKIYYNSSLKSRARELRKKMTLSEILLWKALQKKQLGYTFHRQKPLQNYIVDFYCSELQLAVEVDGASHRHKEAQDQFRDEALQKAGIAVIRIPDIEIKRNFEGVVLFLKRKISEIKEVS